MAGRELTLTPTKRERRKSPAMTFASDPLSPTSSVADTTFEPTIEMMVNDFDDEATLNEEEALANLEAHSGDDEITTLREESEMPIEELLAKYSSMTNITLAPPPIRTGSAGSSRRRRVPKRQLQETCTTSTSTSPEEPTKGAPPEEEEEEVVSPIVDSPSPTPELQEGVMDTEETTITKKHHRSHLLDLYPDQSFSSSAPHTVTTAEDLESFTPLQTLLEQVEAGEEEEEDSDVDSDDARKIIMVGADYQAEIPEGLSQYGDILPYENEDQLIWEPSQVSEREVESYLAKIQETRSMNTTGEEGAAAAECPERPEAEEIAAVTPPVAVPTAAAAAAADPSSDKESVVKDNEQALHLLVQCGYDFKEALRRKRLNVLPLSDTMSSWSEEECQKFEEGIHKFGKDFYQIRQNQVRTRTMRELVQFYYLWKKSERRDQSFALNDTIDHMDVFINEAGNGNGTVAVTGNGTGNGNGNGSCSPHASSCGSSNGHNSNGNAGVEHVSDKDAIRKSTTKNYSIMTGGQTGAAAAGGSRNRSVSFALEEQEQEPEQDQDPNIEEHENVIDSLI